MTDQISQRHEKLAIYTVFASLWVLLWRLPVLQGDDRFFTAASGLPWGKQYLSSVPDFIWQTWALYNGRVADGLGVAWYLFGDDVARVFFAFSYVLFVGLLELYIQLFFAFSQRNLFQLRLLFFCIPFFNAAVNMGIAGQSLMLAASVWNYIIPLNMILIALFPLMRRISGKPLAPVWEGLSFPALFVSLQMHEMLTIAAGGALLGLISYRVSVLREGFVIVTGAVAFAGAVVKVMAPGLWKRAQNNGIGEEVLGLSSLEKLLVRAGSAFSDLPVYYFLAVLGILLVALLAFSVLYGRQFFSLRLHWKIGLTSVLILLWTVFSWKYRFAVAAAGEDVANLVTHVSSKSAAVVLFLGLLSFSALWLCIRDISREISSPLSLFFFSAAVLSMLATAFMAPKLYGHLDRAHYVTVLLLVGSGIVLLCEILLHQTASAQQSSGPSLMICAVFVLSLVAGVNMTLQMAQNRQHWTSVEQQIASVKVGETNTVYFPESLPCEQVTWYFWPDNRERSYRQFSIYYDIPAGTHFETVPQSQECLVTP